MPLIRSLAHRAAGCTADRRRSGPGPGQRQDRQPGRAGPGTTAGTLFKNGVELAIKEINAGGGILGKKISFTTEDTQSNPGVAKGLTQKAVDNEVFAIFGPVYSGSIMVSMAESKRGEVPNFTGGEAAAITAQGNPYVFRTSFGQSVSFPKLVRYVNTRSQKLALIYVNNDFGKGGRDSLVKLLEGTPTRLVADISTDAGQVDFSAAVLKAKQRGRRGADLHQRGGVGARCASCASRAGRSP
jgi:branched-chain amino acid transport system substrate-binding protein